MGTRPEMQFDFPAHYDAKGRLLWAAGLRRPGLVTTTSGAPETAGRAAHDPGGTNGTGGATPIERRPFRAPVRGRETQEGNARRGGGGPTAKAARACPGRAQCG